MNNMRSQEVKKVLFLSIVPPFPNNQGNRLVTLNVMDHLVNNGCRIDAVFQTGGDRKSFEKHFHNKVNVYEVKNINFEERFDIQTRNKIKDLLKTARFDGYNEGIKKEIFYAANHFHPFAYIGDEMVKTARELLAKNHYELILCNYIYCLRVVKELKEMTAQTKRMVITIDAISRLDEQAYTFGIDTSYRACSREMERECLEYADYVVAISQSEREYFKNIGVTREIILSEYNAYDNLKDLSIQKENFHRKEILFAASGNPLNKKCIHDFLTRSWPSVVSRIPGATLVIMGTVSQAVPGNYKNVIIKGMVSYDEYMRQMGSATISINPVYLGTGLKIKTVESISIGLPTVSFPAGIEGLEDLKGQAFLRAKDWVDFADQCVTLLTDYDKWNHMRQRAREIAAKRFSAAVVYKEIDKILNIQ
jgi:glycosyltransferase involved in cell wall biosynthesis